MLVAHRKNPWMSSAVGSTNSRVEKSREISAMTSVAGQFSETPSVQHRGIIYKLSNYERDSLKAFDNSLAHLL